MNITLNTKIFVSGRFKFTLIDTASNNVRLETDWMNNLITNQGLDWFGTGSGATGSYNTPAIFSGAAVGTGSTPPAYTDTTLTSQVAVIDYGADGAILSVNATYTAGPPAYMSLVTTWTFNAGSISANIAEVGFGHLPTGQTNLQCFSHALIVDSFGNPTTITVTSSDTLIVTYQLNWYQNLTDNTYSMMVQGVSYGGTYRMAQNTNTTIYTNAMQPVTNSIGTCIAYSGSIGTVSGTPSGSGANANSYSYIPYNAGTYFLGVTATFNPSTAVFGTGISAIQVISFIGCWQFQVSPAIPKTNVQTLTLTWNVSWSRYP